MTVHVHDLAGCTPTPLGSYLKALGILRLVAEQADPEVRGWWRDERFWIATRLDQDRLIRFFLEEYRPTPILSPWNLGSGFYYDEDPPLTGLETSRAARFALYRETIADARQIAQPFAQLIRKAKQLTQEVKEVKRSLKKGDGRKAEVLAALEAELKAALTGQKEEKEKLIGAFRRRWRGERLRWLEAAIVLDAEGSPLYPALLGTGGNDGRLDFTNNHMRHLARIFDVASDQGGSSSIAQRELRAAILGGAAPGLESSAIGQFMPGRAGGANMAAGFAGESLVNSWDFVLMMEGSLYLGSSVVRWTESSGVVQAAAPFAVFARAAGYPSAASTDESARGEQWMPLWRMPVCSGELASLLREGRARVGREASDSVVDMARAIARLGVARGADAFERYGFIERNGQSNLAVPLGRWRVSPRPHQRLLDELGWWLDMLRRAGRDDTAPVAWRSAARICDESVLAICRNGQDPLRWQRLLLALADAERVLVGNPRRCAKDRLRPIPPLSPEWTRVADDGGPEVRLAVALACQYGTRPHGHPVREHWTPVDATGARFELAASSLAVGPDLVCAGVDLERDCLALLRRRVLRAHSPWKTEAGSAASPSAALPLLAPPACSARHWAIDAFLSRATDDAKVLGLARAFMALRWRDWKEDTLKAPTTPPEPAQPHALHALFRLTHLPSALQRGANQVAVPIEPAVSNRLAAGDLDGAARGALRRLRSSGLRPVIRAVAGDAALARRLAASLAFALHPRDVDRCADSLTKPFEGEPS